MMRVQKTAKSVLLMLCFAACVCLFLTRSVNKTHKHKSTDEIHPESIEVAMAKLSMRAASVITLEHINTEKVSRDELPKGNMVSPLQVIGRVLAVPVFEGQVLTESCFIKDGTGALLAAQIPNGMQGFSVAVSSKAMPDRILLYPGCIVDVLVRYKSTSRTTEGEAISQTMLVGIHVLAISGDSVITTPEEEGATKKRSSSRGTIVTLMVTPVQAEALSLAVQNGRISLSLRNPLDRKIIDFKKTQLLPNNRPDIEKNDIWKRQSKPFVKIDNWKLQPLHDFRIGPCGDVISQTHQTAIGRIPQNQKWEVAMIRGRTVQMIPFE